VIKVNKSSITIPKALAGPRRIYPWHEMEIGNWFDAPLPKRASIISSFSRFKPKEFTTRKIDDKTVRVWRIK